MERRKFIKSALITPALISSISNATLTGQIINEEDRFVINAGVGGNNTNDLLARIDNDCLRHLPEITILTIGTNDMNSRKFIPLDVFQKNMNNVIQQISGIGSQVILTTLMPAYQPYLMTRHAATFYEPEGYQGRLKQINNLLRTIAIDNDVPLLDLHHIFNSVGNIGESADSLMKNEANSGVKDGLHPTPEGYRLMAVAVYEFMLQNGFPRNRVVCFGDSITAGDGGVEGKSYPAYLKSLLKI